MGKANISVIYICYLPYGFNAFSSFISSYLENDAGLEHQLVIVFKGEINNNEEEPYLAKLNQHDITFIKLYYTGRGLDIATYYWTAKQLCTKNIFCLNTKSRLLAENWLLKFYDAAEALPNTICSATGSWQSHVSAAFFYHKKWYDTNLSIKANINRYIALVLASTIWWKAYPLFPNPHIRTNAFFIKRTLFLSLHVGNNLKKGAAYRFESGRHGMSAQLKKKGYQLAVISKDGIVFPESKWADSHTSCIANQENLLVADNQTDKFAEASNEEKKLITWISWKK